MIEALDSFYVQIKNQMAIIAPSQAFGGYVNARDWPLSPVVQNALYLLYLNSVPQSGPSSTMAQTRYEHFCQWVWIILGTDIQSNQQAENRGDRFRTDATIRTNLLSAHYPSYCQKQSYAVNMSTGVVSGTPIQTSTPLPYNAVESIHWTKPRFLSRNDNQKSGLVYGAAAVSIYSWEDVNALVA